MRELIVRGLELERMRAPKYILSGRLREAGAPVAPAENRFDLDEEPQMKLGAVIFFEDNPCDLSRRYWWDDEAF